MELISEFLTEFSTKYPYGKLSETTSFPALPGLCQMPT